MVYPGDTEHVRRETGCLVKSWCSSAPTSVVIVATISPSLTLKLVFVASKILDAIVISQSHHTLTNDPLQLETTQQLLLDIVVIFRCCGDV